MAADAWASVKDTTLEKAWNKLCPKPRDSQENSDTDPDDSQVPQENDDPDEIREIIKEAPGFEECDKANIDDWLNCDVDDPGYQILSDEEIPGFEECDKANIDDWLNCDVDDPGYQILSDEEIVKQIKDDN
ncbi:hypothetical protein QE152_g34471 [Popillia japonica]|uniref:Uncharacterized protein n=1 Tax=Popillia japonica TaxID=7064 RepID=A0AAW1ITK8_POPJA